MHTHVTFVLDSSGSMSAIKDDTVGGFNKFLHDQQPEKATRQYHCSVSTTQSSKCTMHNLLRTLQT
jgi:hypothetical protein